MKTKSIAVIYKRYKHYLLKSVLAAVFVFCIISFCRSGMIYIIYNIIPSNADNYVLICPNYIDNSIDEKNIPEVNIYSVLTRKKVNTIVEYIDGYGQYASLMKKGIYRVEVVYDKNTIEEAQLKIVPGTDAYVMCFSRGDKLVTHLTK